MKLNEREKQIFKAGLFTGLKKKKKRKAGKDYKVNLYTGKKISTKPVFKGPTYVDGKFYDTNFKKPRPLSRELVNNLHKEYDFSGHDSDKVVVDRYVLHMRKKYGTFDRKSGKFLGLIDDE